MSHETILKMIETVDPKDTAKLDEIDARVWCWLNNYKFLCIRHEDGEFDVGTPKRGKYKHTQLFGYCDDDGNKPYTRSRDALKAIRPQGWVYDCGRKYPLGETSQLYARLIERDDHIDGKVTYSVGMPTEELAELHAIIQAIAYERSL